MCLTCLHPNHENNITRPYKEPAIVERRRSRPAGFTAGSINRINKFTQQELSVFKQNTGYTTYRWARARARARAQVQVQVGAGASAGTGAGMPIEAIYRH